MAEALTGVGAAGAVGSTTPVIRIALTGVSATGRIGHLTATDRPGESFNLTAPMAVFELTGVTGAVGSLAIEPPLPVLAMTGESPQPASLELSMLPELSMTGVTGAVGTVELTTPRVILSFGDGANLNLELPLPTLRMTGSSGAIGSVSLRSPLPTLQMSGMTETIGTLRLPLRVPRLTLEVASGQIGTLRLRHKLPTLRMTGVVGSFGTLTLQPPAPELRLQGYFAAIGTVALATPLPQLVMHGSTQGTTAQVAATRMTYALQIERGALTRYTNFPFNSFAVFAGRHLAAGPDGIFELTGDTDAGTAIDSIARFGKTDLGTSRVKRVEHVYIGYRVVKGAKALLLRTYVDGKTRDYGTKPAVSGELHTTRVDLGMGVEARYWQFELRNRDGADFSVDTVEVAPTPVRRRLGASDA